MNRYKNWSLKIKMRLKDWGRGAYFIFRPSLPKTGKFWPSRSNFGMFRPCSTEVWHVSTKLDQKKCALAYSTKDMFRPCATSFGYVSFLNNMSWVIQFQTLYFIIFRLKFFKHFMILWCFFYQNQLICNLDVICNLNAFFIFWNTDLQFK